MDQTTPANIPWWQSNVIRGLAVSLVAKVLAVAHVSAAFPSASQVVDILFDAAQFGGLLWAGYSRTKQPMPNLTPSQSKADALNAAAVSATVPFTSEPAHVDTTANPSAPGAVTLKPLDTPCTAIGPGAKS